MLNRRMLMAGLSAAALAPRATRAATVNDAAGRAVPIPQRVARAFPMKLEGHALSIGYSDRLVGHDLDVGVETGEVLALLGPNGSGKTTLLKTLLGLLAPKAGDVQLDGRTLNNYGSRDRARLMAYVPQSHQATFAFTVETVVLMGRIAHGNLFSRPTVADRTVAA